MIKNQASRSTNRRFAQLLKRVRRQLCFLTLLFFVAAPALQAAAWDVTADFSTSQNPNGDWSYGWKWGAGGTFNPFTKQHIVPSNVQGKIGTSIAWSTSTDPNAWLIVWKNTDTFSLYNVQPGEVSIHPGGGGDHSVVRWTSPVSGPVTIDGWFGAGDYARMSYFIYQNGASIFEIHGTYANGPFSLTEIVSVGATIDFMIGEGYVGGTTPLHATLTYIPLPGAVWLLGSGLAGLLASRRFRKGGHP